jgi:tRNA pseudouridine55 synthase
MTQAETMAQAERQHAPLNGWLVVDKPLGMSSATVVAAVKRVARQCGWPRAKAGHGGTLDPLATGVLPVALGEATKLAGHLLDGCKTYRFVVRFGARTTTEDSEGEVIETSDVRPEREALVAALERWTGRIIQVPPAYSAIKVNGQRAYALARAGAAPALAPREVTISGLRLLDFTGEDATVEVDCSKGTYVRSLARDIAYSAGSVGHVAHLRRLRAGPFAEAQAKSLDNLNSLVQTRGLERALLPVTAGLDDIPALAVNPAQAERLRQGQRLSGRSDISGLHVATHLSVPVALVDVSSAAVRIVRGFNL